MLLLHSKNDAESWLWATLHEMRQLVTQILLNMKRKKFPHQGKHPTSIQ